MILFKGRKIKKLLDEYQSPEVKLKNPTLVKELAQLGPDAIKYTIESFQQRRLPAPKAHYLLESFCDDSCQLLILSLIGDPYDEVRRVAKEMIKRRWAKSSSKILIQYLKESDIYLRNSAVELLCLFRDTSCEQELISMFNTASAEEKKSIIKILGTFERDASNRLIVSALNDTNWHVRRVALKHISRLKLTSSVKRLIEMLSEQDPHIRSLAIDALGNIGDKQATKPLLELLKDDELMVRQKAVDSLIDLADVNSVSDLINLLRHDDVNVRRCAVEVLRNMKDPKTTAALMQAIKDSDWWVRQIATDSLTSLKSGNIVDGFIGLTRDPDENIRRCAVEFFVQVPADEAFGAIVSMLNDSDWWVREKAIDALGKLKKPEAIKPLLSMVNDQAVCTSIPSALAEIASEEAFQHLRDMLYQGAKQLRIEAIKVLQKTKGNECIEDLKKCLADPDKAVRTEAILSLKELTGKIYSSDDAEPPPSSLIKNAVSPGMTVTEAIVVIDLCNSTDIISRYGDSFAMKLMQRLTAIVETIGKREQCQFTKGTGDGFLITFPQAENAVRFSMDVLAAVKKANEQAENNQKINLRFAINIGEAKVDDKGDRIGVAVNMTFRIEGLKPDALIASEGSMLPAEIPLENRIFVTENLEKETANLEWIHSRFVGLAELKGITGLHRIFYLTRKN